MIKGNTYFIIFVALNNNRRYHIGVPFLIDW